MALPRRLPRRGPPGPPSAPRAQFSRRPERRPLLRRPVRVARPPLAATSPTTATPPPRPAPAGPAAADGRLRPCRLHRIRGAPPSPSLLAGAPPPPSGGLLPQLRREQLRPRLGNRARSGSSEP
nr:atherin-like [Aegilops tauschii subsp. strangulata]